MWAPSSVHLRIQRSVIICWRPINSVRSVPYRYKFGWLQRSRKLLKKRGFRLRGPDTHRQLFRNRTREELPTIGGSPALASAWALALTGSTRAANHNDYDSCALAYSEDNETNLLVVDTAPPFFPEQGRPIRAATNRHIRNSLLVAALGEQPLSLRSYNDRKGCAIGYSQRLLNKENFIHIVNKNDGQYRGSHQNARFVGVDR